MNPKLNRHPAIPMLLDTVVNLRENVFDVIFNKSLLIPNVSGLNRILHKTSENKKAPNRRIQKAIELCGCPPLGLTSTTISLIFMPQLTTGSL